MAASKWATGNNKPFPSILVNNSQGLGYFSISKPTSTAGTSYETSLTLQRRMNWQAAYHNSVLNQTLQLCFDTTSFALEAGRQISMWQNSESFFPSGSTQKPVARAEPEERFHHHIIHNTLNTLWVGSRLNFPVAGSSFTSGLETGRDSLVYLTAPPSKGQIWPKGLLFANPCKE